MKTPTFKIFSMKKIYAAVKCKQQFLGGERRMNEQETLMLFVKISQQRMHRHYLPKLIQSIQVIHTDVLWDEQSENLNSIGGIILHICEHIKRSSTRFSNLLHTEYGEGIEAYFPNENLSPNELCLVVNETFTEFYSVMDNLLARMPEQIDMHRLFHLVEHTKPVKDFIGITMCNLLITQRRRTVLLW